MATRIYGCIEEYGLLRGAEQNNIYHHNKKVIQKLPIADEWPPLTKNMFAITYCNLDKPGINYAYSGRIIHFGANFKSIEHDWNKWKTKFETLLKQLYWISANVHVKTEYDDTHNFSWSINLNKWHIDNTINIVPIKNEYWDYEETKTWYNS